MKEIGWEGERGIERKVKRREGEDQKSFRKRFAVAPFKVGGPLLYVEMFINTLIDTLC
jgi:hypothetical protein